MSDLTGSNSCATMQAARVLSHPSRSNHNADRTSIMANDESTRAVAQSQIPLPTSSAFKNILNHRFGRLTVIEFRGMRRGESLWRCQCDCGGEVTTTKSHLRGNTRSCGCLQIENRIQKATTHGGRRKPEYKVWAGIKSRCYCKTNSRYADYGGRGIKVCDRWLESFANFYADMGPRPSPQHELDRFPDNNGDYRPGNCRWTTSRQNNRNRRNNRQIAFDGKCLCVTEWAEVTGLTISAINHRLDDGWSPERILATPLRMRGHRSQTQS